MSTTLPLEMNTWFLFPVYVLCAELLWANASPLTCHLSAGIILVPDCSPGVRE